MYDINSTRFSGVVDRIFPSRNEDGEYEFYRFSLRVEGRYGGRHKRFFVKVAVANPGMIAFAERQLKRGCRVYVEGHLETFRVEDGDGHEILASHIMIPDREAARV